MSIDDDGEACVHIDGAHAVHVDRKENSGMHSTMGKVEMMNASKKLGLVTVSSTETEFFSDG